MDDPVAEIDGVIQALCTASPSIQRAAIETYFTPSASFTHPFCRTGSFNGSRWFIAKIYRWYKILGSCVDVHVDSTSFDTNNMILYVSIHQTFKMWLVPFYKAQASLVTVLHLTQDPEHQRHRGRQTQLQDVEQKENEPSKFGQAKQKKCADASDGSNSRGIGKKYYIQSQNDLYQTSEWIKFVVPFGVGVTLLMVWQFLSTILCTIGAIVGWPITWLEENGTRGSGERTESKEVLGTN